VTSVCGPTVASTLTDAGAPAPDEVAARVFGDRLPLATHYAQLLAGDGIEHGLLGPAERDRIWSRHLVNSAVVSELLPEDARLVDVGSGAGLPGLAIACRRPDLRVDLVEPTLRRVEFLVRAVRALGLGDQVHVVRGRAESVDVVETVGQADWVVARAVAPLGRLAGWCLPLTRSGGRLLAMKGERAEQEIDADTAAIRSAGGVVERIARCGEGVIADPVRVVVVRRA
jgi:16S rRNA (guanine527-N7)-methyltransferase